MSPSSLEDMRGDDTGNGSLSRMSQPMWPNVAQRRQRGPGFAKPSPRLHEIRDAATALSKSPDDSELIRDLAALIQMEVESDLTPRAVGKKIFPTKRAAALLRFYGPTLRATTKKQVLRTIHGSLRDVATRERTASASTLVGEHRAAEMLGVTVHDLRAMCCDPSCRRQLGWPRPLGVRILLDTRALNGATSQEFLASLPPTDPWPKTAWPKGWR